MSLVTLKYILIDFTSFLYHATHVSKCDSVKHIQVVLSEKGSEEFVSGCRRSVPVSMATGARMIGQPGDPSREIEDRHYVNAAFKLNLII